MSKSKNKGKGKGKGKKQTPQQLPAPHEREPDFEMVSALAKDALDPKSGVSAEEIEQQIPHLHPEEAAVFLKILTITLKRRRIQLVGYLCAMFFIVFGMFFALYIWGRREPGDFIAWVFVVPPGLAALSIWLFGAWSNRIK